MPVGQNLTDYSLQNVYVDENLLPGYTPDSVDPEHPKSNGSGGSSVDYELLIKLKGPKQAREWLGKTVHYSEEDRRRMFNELVAWYERRKQEIVVSKQCPKNFTLCTFSSDSLSQTGYYNNTPDDCVPFGCNK